MAIDAVRFEKDLQRLRDNDPELTEVYLSFQNLTDEDIIVFATAIENNNSITELKLFNNNLGKASEAALIALAQAIENNNSIRTLGLGADNLGDASEAALIALAKAIENNNSITTLDLDKNNLDNASEIALIALAQAIENNNSITLLDLICNDFGNASEAALNALAKAFETNNSITTLNLYSNNLGNSEAALIALAKAIETNNSITMLSLGYNYLGNASEVALIALVQAIETNNSITTLDLGFNNHFDKASEAALNALAKAIENNNSITALDLGLNKFGDAGEAALIALAKAIETNNSITTLDLGFNNLGNASEAALIALVEAIENNNSITTLNLRHNDLDNASEAAFNARLERGENVTLCEVSGIALSAKARDALKRNQQIHDALTAAEKTLNPEVTDEAYDPDDARATLPTPTLDKLDEAIQQLQTALEYIEAISIDQALSTQVQAKREALYQVMERCYRRKADVYFENQQIENAIDTLLTAPTTCPNVAQLRQFAFVDMFNASREDLGVSPAFFQALLHCISKDSDMLAHLTSGESEFDFLLQGIAFEDGKPQEDINRTPDLELKPDARVRMLKSIVDANTKTTDSAHPIAKTSPLFSSGAAAQTAIKPEDAENIAKLTRAMERLSSAVQQEEAESAIARGSI